MQFTDFTFLFLFIPAFFLVFFILPTKFKVVWILLGSAFFYFWAEPIFFWILLIQIVINYIFAALIDRTRKNGWLSRTLLVLIVLIDLGLMIFFRESTTLLSIFKVSVDIPPFLDRVFFPLGISFITFSLLSYIFDIAKGSLTDKGNFFQFANYILLFPKIQQGPIQDFNQFQKSFLNFKFSASNLYNGISRFILGLAKKVLIADSLAPVAESVFTANLGEVGFGVAWYALIAFGLRVYFDFSGYTDMAIGIGIAMGFELPENFNNPYVCVSVADFWRRWHMTLTAWFRKYVFYPLERTLRNLGALRQPVNLLIIFILTGAWHGFSPNFLIWGAYYGFILALEAIGLGRMISRLPKFLQHLYALLLVFFGWIFFRFSTPSNWPIFLRALFGLNGLTNNITTRTLNILGYLPIVIIAIILCIPIPWKKLETDHKAIQVLSVALQIGLLILSIAFLVEGGYQSFIYRQF